MLKILYAADNRKSSFYSLKRFLDTYSDFYQIKVAAYSASIQNLNVNWNLDALLDFRGKKTDLSFSNSNYPLYAREIKRFAPNIIISDLEIYSSYIGIEMGIPVWQVSPLLLYYAAEDKLNIYKYHSALFKWDSRRDDYTKYVIKNSDKRLILSHLGDTVAPPKVDTFFDWVRPNYELLDKPQPIINIYSSGIGAADAYFNGQYVNLEIDYSDTEAIVVARYNEVAGLNINKKISKALFKPHINDNVKFLSQYLANADI